MLSPHSQPRARAGARLQSAAFARCHSLCNPSVLEAARKLLFTFRCSAACTRPRARITARSRASLLVHLWDDRVARSRLRTLLCSRRRPSVLTFDSRFHPPLPNMFSAWVGRAFANIIRCARPHALHARFTCSRSFDRCSLPAPRNNRRLRSRLTTDEACVVALR